LVIALVIADLLTEPNGVTGRAIQHFIDHERPLFKKNAPALISRGIFWFGKFDCHPS
jgi:hypothetical protein